MVSTWIYEEVIWSLVPGIGGIKYCLNCLLGLILSKWFCLCKSCIHIWKGVLDTPFKRLESQVLLGDALHDPQVLTVCIVVNSTMWPVISAKVNASFTLCFNNRSGGRGWRLDFWVCSGPRNPLDVVVSVFVLGQGKEIYLVPSRVYFLRSRRSSNS